MPLALNFSMPVSLSSTLVEQLAIRLSCQKTAAKSLVISQRGERSEGGEAGQTNACANFTLRRFRLAMIALLFTLAGCDRITGAADQKISDAEAIGYACRVSFKKPEDCMKENDAQSTTYVLAGWKAADKDIAEKTLDPSMGADRTARAASAPVATDTAKSPAKSDTSKEPAPDKKPEKSH